MKFGEALEKLRSGFRITRKKWDRGYYIEGAVVRDRHVAHICYYPKGGHPVCQSWRPIIDDLFAEDWEAIDPFKDIWDD